MTSPVAIVGGKVGPSALAAGMDWDKVKDTITQPSGSNVGAQTAAGTSNYIQVSR